MEPTFNITISVTADNPETFEEVFDTLSKMAKETLLAGRDIAPLGPWAGGIEEGWFKIEVVF